MKKFEHREGDTYELGPSPCATHVPFRQWRDGRPIATGVGIPCASPADLPPGTDALFLQRPGKDGRQAATYCPPMTSRGGSDGAVRTPAATKAYLSGWDATFGGARQGKKGPAN